MGSWKTPEDLKYTRNDEWLRIEGSIGTIGLTDYAQNQLNDLVYVDLPDKGDTLKKGTAICAVESVKAASDIYAPISGKITEVNQALEDEPELINSDPYGKGWVIKFEIADPDEAADLMDAAAYAAYCDSRE
ncbi:MAG: glycine cleavage system protein GcvH [Chloroflexi bacterium]|nr:glycine cleavage system protein GcvH [Chloroflexota bacterium]